MNYKKAYIPPTTISYYINLKPIMLGSGSTNIKVAPNDYDGRDVLAPKHHTSVWNNDGLG